MGGRQRGVTEREGERWGRQRGVTEREGEWGYIESGDRDGRRVVVDRKW